MTIISSLARLQFYARLVTPCFSILLLIGVASAQTDRIRTVGLENEAVKNYEFDFTFASFANPTINNLGQTAFDSRIAGATVTGANNYAMFAESGGNGLQLVVRGGKPAPKIPDRNLYNYSQRVPQIFDNEQVAFAHNLAGVVSGISDGLLYRGDINDLELVYRQNNQAPAGSRSDIQGFNEVEYNANTKLAFIGDYPDGETIYAERTPGSFTKITETGGTAPGTGGAEFDQFHSLRFNKALTTSFVGGLTGTGITGDNNSGIFRDTVSSGLELVLRKGDIAPGTSARFADTEGKSAFRSPEMNETGHLAFIARLNSSITSDEIVYRETNSGFEVVVREGDAVSGLNAVFRNLDPLSSTRGNSLRMNNNGDLAFVSDFTGASITSLDNEGLFRDRDGNLEMVIRKGDQAAGLDSGINYGSFDLATFAFNDNGQFALFARLAGTGVTSSNDEALFLSDAEGAFELIAREGALFNVADGDDPEDWRTIQSIGFDSDGGFNNLGQVAFRANFTDGTSGIFVAGNISAVPEPAMLSLLLATGFAFILRRRACRPA